MNLKQQSGFTLLELLLTTGLVMGLLIPLAQMTSDARINMKETNTAQHFKVVMNAASQYTKDNNTVIQQNATSTVPAIITPAMLRATNYLSAGFTGVNSYGQSVQAEVLQPTPGNLEVKIISIGGREIPEIQAPSIATKIGAAGGYTPITTPTTAQGSKAGWTAPLTYNTQPGAGHLVGLMYFSNGQLVKDYLHRHAVPGCPECTSMYTPLNMRATAIENTSDALCVVGDASTYGRIAADLNGAVLSCRLGKWKKQGSSFWLDPVADYNALNLITTDPIGSVRMTLDKARGYMWDGTKWDALAVDQNGNLTVPGTMTAETVQLTKVVVEGTACPETGRLARDANGLTLSCQSGHYGPASRMPKSYRYTFTSSTAWTVPQGIKSAFVSLAGGGAGGVTHWGYAVDGFSDTIIISGASGGFLTAYPVNLTPGEVIPITIGAGGPAVNANTSISAQAGTTSFGAYLSCTGGANYTAPGSCGAQGGFGSYGTYNVSAAGIYNGGETPLGYGSGGSASRCWGCAGIYPATGADGYQGVVYVDAMY